MFGGYGSSIASMAGLVAKEGGGRRTNMRKVCASQGCEAVGLRLFKYPHVMARTAVFLKNVVCPQSAGKTCTLYVHVESQDEVTANDNGLFKFLVDGLPPSPGPTDGTGLFRWVLNHPDSGNIEFEARSFAVVATETNRIPNQTHSVEVDIACEDITGELLYRRDWAGKLESWCLYTIARIASWWGIGRHRCRRIPLLKDHPSSWLHRSFPSRLPCLAFWT
jgi:hypothetical protein